jgi:hypothetical protein
MASTLNNFNKKIFDNIPDFTDWVKSLEWMEEGQKLIASMPRKEFLEDETFSLEWSEIRENARAPFGYYPCIQWRKFVLAVFFADYVSYAKDVDRVGFERLLFVMHAFPEGFRVWWTKLLDGQWWPVGYTGWYPMLETAFELFEKSPHKLNDRMVVPAEGRYLYLFNFSVPLQFKKSELSKKLIKSYVEDINKQKAIGLACVTVSEDGVRIANGFGMSHAGDLIVDGCSEGVYIVRQILT